MIKDSEDCFADVGDDEPAIALAESFRFADCVRRPRLADMIAAATAR